MKMSLQTSIVIQCLAGFHLSNRSSTSEAALSRGVGSALCDNGGVSTVTELVDSDYEALFRRITANNPTNYRISCFLNDRPQHYTQPSTETARQSTSSQTRTSA